MFMSRNGYFTNVESKINQVEGQADDNIWSARHYFTDAMLVGLGNCNLYYNLTSINLFQFLFSITSFFFHK